MHRYLTCDKTKCTGCRICELVCSEEKEGLYNPLKSRIKVVKPDPITDIALACRFCEKPSCVRSCPRDALRKSQDNDVVLVDETKCSGCSWCLEACEFGALASPPDRKTVIVCDLCQGNPKCVSACPFGALQLATPNTLAQRARLAAVRSLIE
jgi:Fe-S-cluster-containing hydrogenase component 2